VKLEITKLTVNDLVNLIDPINNLIEKAHLKIQNIKNSEGITGVNFGYSGKHTSHSVVTGVVTCFCYEEINILKFISRIIFSINCKHLYQDGNKRTTIFALDSILRYFGFFLNYSNLSDEELIEKYSNFITRVAGYKQDDELAPKTDDEVIMFITNFLKSSIQIYVFKK
jgi:prophage maintenance system killer protein